MRSVEPLKGQSFDIIIVGGGIYGVATAWEASIRGMTVCLVEKGDFGAETSSNSLKIIHGGLRYLQHANLARMRESIQERRTLQKLAPHMVSPIRFTVPVAGQLTSMAYGLAGKINDLISMDRNAGLPASRHMPNGKWLSRSKIVERFPWLSPTENAGGIEWYDCQAYSTERLLISFLKSAIHRGVVAANYVRAVRLIKKGSRVIGIVAHDEETSEQITITGDIVINATGPGANDFLVANDISNTDRIFEPSLAFNVLLDQDIVTEAVGVSLGERYKDSDAVTGQAGRMYFLVPWRGKTLIGTKHLRCPGQDDCSVSDIRPADALALVRSIASSYPELRLQDDRIRHVFRGLLPEARRSSSTPEVQLQKNHDIIDHSKRDGVEALISVIGVKWTGARGVAEELIDLVSRKLNKGEHKTGKRELAGGRFTDFDNEYQTMLTARPQSLSEEIASHIISTRGTEAIMVFDAVRSNPDLARPIAEGSLVCAADIVASCQESVVHLDDVLLRRTEALVLNDLGETATSNCANHVAAALGWSKQKLHRELDRLQSIRECR